MVLPVRTRLSLRRVRKLRMYRCFSPSQISSKLPKTAPLRSRTDSHETAQEPAEIQNAKSPSRSGSLDLITLSIASAHSCHQANNNGLYSSLKALPEPLNRPLTRRHRERPNSFEPKGLRYNGIQRIIERQTLSEDWGSYQPLIGRNTKEMRSSARSPNARLRHAKNISPDSDEICRILQDNYFLHEKQV